MSTTSFDALYHPSYVPTANWAKVQFLLWDRLYRIVPEDMQAEFGDKYVECTYGINPDTMPMLPPESGDLGYYGKHRVSLERAFRRISRKAKGNLKEPHQFFGIHPRKAPRWLFEMLEGMNLAKEMEQRHGTWIDKHHWIEEDAGYLIMSCLGSRMASRRGLEIVTDRRMSFYVTAAMEIAEDPSDREGLSMEGVLATAVFQLYVPRNLDSLTFKQVFELRKEYAALRHAFHAAVRRVSKSHNLKGIVQKKRAQEALGECLREFNEEERRFKRGRVGRFFGDWKTQTVGVCLGAIGATIAGGPLAGLAFTIGGGTIALANALLNKREPSDFEQSFHYLHILDKKLKARGCARGICQYLPNTTSSRSG